MIAEFIHYFTIAATACINSIGVGIGEGLTSLAALEAINIQPQAKNDIAKVSILGTALIETAAILGVTFSIILLFESRAATNIFYKYIAELGIAFALCLPGFTIGLLSSLPAQAACFSIARQPFFAQPILRLMLITQSIIQTPIIFGFIIGMFINSQSLYLSSLVDSIRLISSGLCIGLGSIGPAMGLAHFAQTACQGIGRNKASYNTIFPFTLLSQAIIETPILFSLIISILLITVNPVTSSSLFYAWIFLGSAFCMGLGTIGPGISSGKTASAACKEIALNPSNYSLLARTSMLAQGLIDTCAIYALLIALLLLFMP